MLSLAGCAHQPVSWTPDSVRPPAPSEAAITVPAALAERAQPVTIAEPPAAEQVRDAGETVLPVTRDGAILAGLLGNRFIEVARFGPEIDATYIDEARADFDPRLLASVSTGRQRLYGNGLESSSIPGALPATGTAGVTLSNVERLLEQVQRLNQTVDLLDAGGDLSIGSNSGSLRVEQWLPTGTMLFLTGSGLAEHGDADGSRSAWAAGVAQPLLRGANMRANLAGLRQAKNLAAQSEHEFRRNVMEVVRQIEATYWELELAHEVLRIREFGVRLAEEQMRREEGLLAVGKALRGDVMTAKAEHAARQADLADALGTLESQTIELIRLMRPSDTPRWELALHPADEATVVEVSVDPQASEDLAMQFRPELAQARLTLANLELDVLRTRNELLPRLDVVGSYGEGRGATTLATGSGSRDADTYSIGLEFETGIPNRAEKARHRRARLENERGASIIGQLEESIAAEVRRAVVELTRQWQRLAATAEAVLSREEAVRVIQGRREVGKATNLDVLQVERDFIESRVDDATARVRYIQALTKLYAAEGTLLERRGIALDAIAAEETPLGKPTYEAE